MMLDFDSSLVTSDGHRCRMRAIVVNPRLSVVAHLVLSVTPWHRTRLLVPISAVDASIQRDGEEMLRLGMTHPELLALGPVEQATFVEGGPPDHLPAETAYTRMQSWPYYSSPRSPIGGDWVEHDYDDPGRGGLWVERRDVLPTDCEEVARSSWMVDRDFRLVGLVQGFETTDEHTLVRVIVRRGKPWHHRRMGVPASDIRSMHLRLVAVRLARDEIAALPSVGAASLAHRVDRGSAA